MRPDAACRRCTEWFACRIFERAYSPGTRVPLAQPHPSAAHALVSRPNTLIGLTPAHAAAFESHAANPRLRRCCFCAGPAGPYPQCGTYEGVEYNVNKQGRSVL